MPFGVSEWTPIRLLMSNRSRANMKARLNWRWAEVHIHSSARPRSAPPSFPAAISAASNWSWAFSPNGSFQRTQKPRNAQTGAEFLSFNSSYARVWLSTSLKSRLHLLSHLVEGDFSFPSSLCLRMSNLASLKKCFYFLPSVWPWVTDSAVYLDNKQLNTFKTGFTEDCKQSPYMKCPLLDLQCA